MPKRYAVHVRRVTLCKKFGHFHQHLYSHIFGNMTMQCNQTYKESHAREMAEIDDAYERECAEIAATFDVMQDVSQDVDERREDIKRTFSIQRSVIRQLYKQQRVRMVLEEWFN